MTPDVIEEHFTEYTSSSKDIYYKIDTFLPNPSSNMSIHDVLRKVGALVNSLSLKPQAIPDMQRIIQVSASG